MSPSQDSQRLAIPRVFLSLSGVDEQFVTNVHNSLPIGLAYFYRKSFKTGALLIEEMETSISSSSLFALFVSNAALASHWVHFEMERARLQMITRSDFRLAIFPVESTVQLSDLPEWMREYWIGQSGFTPRDIARQIRAILTEIGAATSTAPKRIFGRGSLMDLSARTYYDHTLNNTDDANVFIFPGIAGIGRRTFAREFLKSVLEAQPSLALGPVLMLPLYADLVDIHRALRNEIDFPIRLRELEESMSEFGSYDEGGQLDEIVSSLGHFGSIGQAVTIVTGNGLFLDDGSPKSWTLPLFERLSLDKSKILVLVTNRQFPISVLNRTTNVIQIHVPELQDHDIRALYASACTDLGLDAIAPSTELVRSIGGHAGITRSAVRLVAQFGKEIIERKPHILFNIQTEVLSENLRTDALSTVEQDLLSILSWVPAVSGNLLFDTLGEKYNGRDDEIVEAIQNLILGCIVQSAGEAYYISSPLRYMFRRKHGYGDEILLKRFGDLLEKQWRGADDSNGFLAVEVIDSLVYMHALAGKAMPQSLRHLLTASVVLEVIRDTYGRARDDRELYARVISWGEVATEMICDEVTREEILSFAVRARARLRQFREARELLEVFDNRSYRSRYNLRGFVHRLDGRWNEAILEYRKSIEIRKWLRSSIQELALCYQRLGRMEELRSLIERHRGVVEDSAILLETLAGIFLAEGKFDEAEAAVQKLRSLPDDDGRSGRRMAQIMMRRDKNFAGAVRVLNFLVQDGIGHLGYNKSTRAIAAAYAGMVDLSRDDINYVRSKMENGVKVSKRLNTHLRLAQGDFAGAYQELKTIGHESVMDRMLLARIHEAKANDASTPPTERDKLIEMAEDIRGQSKVTTELDIGFLM